jgi:hypothetical protein
MHSAHVCKVKLWNFWGVNDIIGTLGVLSVTTCLKYSQYIIFICKFLKNHQKILLTYKMLHYIIT